MPGFKITSSPINLSGNVFYLVTMEDIGDEKRRSAPERIFFHDLLNSAAGFNGLLKILKVGSTPEKTTELINLSDETNRSIIGEITLHRQMRAAEDGYLQVKIEPTN